MLPFSISGGEVELDLALAQRRAAHDLLDRGVHHGGGGAGGLDRGEGNEPDAGDQPGRIDQETAACGMRVRVLMTPKCS